MELSLIAAALNVASPSGRVELKLATFYDRLPAKSSLLLFCFFPEEGNSASASKPTFTVFGLLNRKSLFELPKPTIELASRSHELVS